ncbi:hypothetical protein LJ655_26170 [Paraburkholderia sp. MMS20-SJTN17]|uniref:Uncharacterized protein n=1 Tax=Paraburkholderia translucens TaxID=2886945 RepID=A0ABS8KKQ4_9BURK|nr:hypothetical protein [Paraburkholderia sp. MMS20-SJTN17]MCC8405305.1 hypothetical protein [Paraburkholderia sp. MMS20-SJTN17]
MTKLSEQFPIERAHSSARLHSAACSHGLVSQLATERSAAQKDFLSSVFVRRSVEREVSLHRPIQSRRNR